MLTPSALAPARASIRRPLPRRSTSIYCWSNKPVLHRPVEPSQYTSLALTSRLVEAGADPSVGSVGDALDNALAETTLGSFKTELIRRQGPWRDIDHVEIETMTWVDFFNTERPHEYLDNLTPVTVENLHYAQTQQATPVS